MWLLHFSSFLFLSFLSFLLISIFLVTICLACIAQVVLFLFNHDLSLVLLLNLFFVNLLKLLAESFVAVFLIPLKLLGY